VLQARLEAAQAVVKKKHCGTSKILKDGQRLSITPSFTKLVHLFTLHLNPEPLFSISSYL